MESLIFTRGRFGEGLLTGHSQIFTNTNTNTQGGFGEGPLDGAFPLPSLEGSGLPGQVRADPEFEHSSSEIKGFSGTYWVFFFKLSLPNFSTKNKIAKQPIRAFLSKGSPLER